jgi:hypothetical protein
VTWADLYRNTRVQEAIFETLTKQYELARVEEARETPSVKVLDPADVPERKSYPPRTVFVLMGTMCACVFGCVWVLGSARWQKVNPADPGKRLVHEIFQTLRTRVSGIVSRVGRRDDEQKSA